MIPCSEIGLAQRITAEGVTMNESARRPKSASSQGEGLAPQQKPPRVTAVRRTLSYSAKILRALRYLRRANYFLSLGTATGDRLRWLTHEGCDALRSIVRVYEQEFGSLEDVGAAQCLRSSRAVNQDAARLAYALQRIVFDIVHRWIVPLSTQNSNEMAAVGEPVSSRFPEYPFLGLTSSRCIDDFGSYLDCLRLHELEATADIIRAQLIDRFIPTPKQLALYAAVKNHDYVKDGRLTKEKLAEKVGSDGSDLYPDERHGLRKLKELEFIETDPRYGYVTGEELRHPLLQRRR